MLRGLHAGPEGAELLVGDYDAYLESTRTAAEAGNGVQRPAASGRAAKKAVSREKKQGLSFREQREYENLPDGIGLKEAELRRLEEQFQQPARDPRVLETRARRYHALREEVEHKTARWEELAERAAE